MSTLSVANLDIVNLTGLSAVAIGNSTVNSTSNSTILMLRNTSTTVNTSASGLVVGVSAINSTAVVVGTSIINSTAVNATAIFVNGTPVLTTALSATTADQQITGGARVTVNDLGNVSGTTVTPDPGDRPMAKVTNNGAWTLAPGSNFGNYILDIVNTTGAAIPTTSGWTKVSGDSLDATTSSKFRCFCSVTADFSLLNVVKIV